MGEGKYAYMVCAKVYGADTLGPASSEVMAGQPVVCRLNRMERVALAFDGALMRRTHHALLIAFDTADAAFFGACEMQRRCADLPHLPGSRLLLQIGIHRALPQHDQSPRPHVAWLDAYRPERREHARRLAFDVADRLACIAQNDGIIVSTSVFEQLAPTVQRIGEAVADAGQDQPAQAFYWRAVLKCQDPAQNAACVDRQPFPRAVLRHGRRELEIDPRHPVVTIGRSPGCVVNIGSHFASRLHARVEIRDGSCVLIDQSSNGTSIAYASGEEVLLRNQSIALGGSGRLGFGQSAGDPRAETIEFQVVDMDIDLAAVGPDTENAENDECAA